MALKLMLLTGDPQFAEIAQSAGVDRIFFDLEYLNKHERQRGRNTFISKNTIDDLPPVRKVLTESTLLVRTNPMNPYLGDEIERVIDFGADMLMLPMVVDQHDVEEFVRLVNGRAGVCIMLETPQSLARIHHIIAVDGVDEFFIGLNDLHIGMMLSFMFELVSDGIVEYMTTILKSQSLPFGFGGIAKLGEGLLPSENILGEHYRLGSQTVILSRTFKGEPSRDETTKHMPDLAIEVEKIRAKEKEISTWDSSQFEANHQFVSSKVDMIVAQIDSRKHQ